MFKHVWRMQHPDFMENYPPELVEAAIQKDLQRWLDSDMKATWYDEPIVP